MRTRSCVRSAARSVAWGLGAAVGAYAAYVGLTWWRYGCVRPPSEGERDELLDRYMPVYEVAERHHVRVAAPADATLAAAQDLSLLQLPVVRALIKGRELILGAPSDKRPQPNGLLAAVQAIGWVVLDEVPGHEVVVGCVTKPWEPLVTFRSIPPEDFGAFDEPDYVKIAWTLRADPIGPGASIFRTETRVVATDRSARTRFRRYWAFFSPGIILIRGAALQRLKADAERVFTPKPVPQVSV